MKKFLLIFVSLLLLFSTSCSEAQTQMDMNTSASEAYKQADKTLNKTYQTIVAEYQSDKAFLQNLKVAQKLWIQFRDAELNMKYPEASSYYGSIYPVCVSNYLEKLTKERTATLNQWLVGIEEGNVCGGSVKIKDASNEETYLVQGKSFYGLSIGDIIAQKMDALTKDVLQTGEGDFDIYTIKNGNGEILANVFPDPMNESKIGDITIISPLAKTHKGIHVGMTFGHLEQILGSLEAHGSEIEGYTSVMKDGLRYRLDANFWAYDIDQSKIDKGTKILEITITR